MPASNVSGSRKIGWFAAFDPRFLRSPSVLALIAANLVPLFGVLFWDWNLYALIVLYWMETGIIGLFGVIHIAILKRWSALFLVPFFIVHFGVFMIVHLLFLTAFFFSQDADFEDLPGILWMLLTEYGLWLAMVPLFISHAVSFFLNVLRPMWRGRGGSPSGVATPRRQDGDAMFSPYARVMMMHVTIVIGGILAAVFGTPVAAFVLLVALKTTVDVAAHVRKNFAPLEA